MRLETRCLNSSYCPPQFCFKLHVKRHRSQVSWVHLLEPNTKSEQTQHRLSRYKFLTSEPARLILRQVWKEVQKKHPFTGEAICLLPDHLHCIWRLPEGDDDYPKRRRLIKGMFSRRYLKAGGIAGQLNHNPNETEDWGSEPSFVF